MKPRSAILGAISLCHCLNDLMQSVLPAVYPILEGRLRVSTSARSASSPSPTRPRRRCCSRSIGYFTDRSAEALLAGHRHGVHADRPAPAVVRAVVRRDPRSRSRCVGIGSSIFHPESSRVARLASGRPARLRAVALPGRRQRRARRWGRCSPRSSCCRNGQRSIAWFALTALVGDDHPDARRRAGARRTSSAQAARPRRAPARRLPRRQRALRSLAILVLLVFSKNVYLASLTSFYTFYLIHKFGDLGAERAAAPVRVPRRRRRRHVHRRAGRRSHRPQVR